MLTVGSLFSGIGGIDLGLERAGMRVIWQSEIEPYACRVLAHHWPDVPNLGDVTMIDWSTVERPDLICGGFPCQPVSVAGRRLAQRDERWLWPAFAYCVRSLRPRLVIVENVPGLLVRGMGDVLGDLAALGYDAEWTGIPAAAVGAPHLRWRVFIVAYAQGSGLEGDGQGLPRQGRDDVAHSEVVTVGAGLRQGDPAGGRRRRPSNGGSPEHVVDTDRRRHGTPQGAVLAGWHSPVPSGWWATEPDVGRVAYGIPDRVDRLRCLGNAVVPQVAELVGRRLVQHIDGSEGGQDG